MKNSAMIKNLLRRRDQITTLGLVAVFFLIWEILAKQGKISAIIFPAPSVILTTFMRSLVTGEYLTDTLISLKRLFAGFLVGGGSGLVLGLIMGWSKRLRNVLDPIIAAVHPVPKFALLPMMIIFFGIGNSSKIAMVSIAAFFPMLINTMAGVLQINPTFYDVVENYGATKFDVFKLVLLPGSLPLVMTGARLSLKAALTITVGVEMVFGNTGLGSQLWLAWETMRMIHLYSILLIVSFVGFASNFILERTKRILLPWHQEIRSSD